MKKGISYALFGYGKDRHPECFDLISYTRALLWSMRMSRIIFPGWEVILETDKPTYMGNQGLLDGLKRCGLVLHINEEAEMTKAMLWRLKPVFDYNHYSHIICRDLDSPPTYREAQCVQEWINSDLAAHAIADSISHGIPMLGGLVGFHTGYWPMRTGIQHWVHLFEGVNINFNHKGADQTFLNQYIYPKFASLQNPSIMQHYLLGMPNTFLPGYRNSIPNIEVDGVNREDAIESNDTCSHMGQAGWLLPQTFRFFNKHKEQFADIYEVEKQFPEVAYWVKDKIFE